MSVTGVPPDLKRLFKATSPFSLPSWLRYVWRSHPCRLFATLLIASQLGACASPSSRELLESRQDAANPSRDTVWTDRFYMGQPSVPDKDKEHWQFFFKDCELAKRSRRPSRSEWDCKEK